MEDIYKVTNNGNTIDQSWLTVTVYQILVQEVLLRPRSMFFDKNDNLFMYSGVSTGSGQNIKT